MARIDIGLRQARKLVNLPFAERLTFIAEGLPILLQSARGLYAASEAVSQMPRESMVLKGHAEEEAAKILILMDIMRCPKKQVSGRIGVLMGWYYDHLARLLYAEACQWRPVDLKELRGIIDRRRVTHYVEGNMGEFIVPNDLIYRRETRLYADIEALDDGSLQWVGPSGNVGFYNPKPDALVVAEALGVFGAFTVEGLELISSIWSEVDFQDETPAQENDRLIEATLTQLVERKMASESATTDNARDLYGRWQMPLYALDMKAREVARSALEAEQERLLLVEMGVENEY
ncbi:hypothetical protein [Rhizobium ruizarguesonis]|uniref:hypothetical protein n=1 Tax=Rhizobium ruizarguesonis TaxID=2081791 RepID=UPI000949A573|nr:hypothetical protein [Rhizobium ruizarguesonis]UED35956.1 hypothetical protein BSO17_34120 [Rhizobium ruizarguesonis]